MYEAYVKKLQRKGCPQKERVYKAHYLRFRYQKRWAIMGSHPVQQTDAKGVPADQVLQPAEQLLLQKLRAHK